MSTSSPLIKSTNPNYHTGSGLMLEVKFETSNNWSKLKSATTYNRNSVISVENQIKELQSVQDNWRLRGSKQYYNAEYRIGQYEHQTGSEYAWVGSHILLERTKPL